MTSVRFIFHRHPFDPNGGASSRISRLMMEAAAASAPVSATVLSTQRWESPWPIDCVDKPPLRPLRVAARSQFDRRSLIHTRFRIPGLRDQLRGTSEDRYAAHHTYMAESFLDARGSTASEQLCINLDVSESAVLKSRRDLPLLRHFESGRTWRDEVRCLSEARAVAGFDEGELELYSRSGVAAEYILRPCFASEKLTPIGRARHLLYLGDRTWKPNYLALARLLKLWGALVERCPGARLLVVGRGPLPPNSTQEGVRVLGYLDSVDQVWDDTRALVAPITIGGGVRIKILEAASRGVPVVASPAGLGSIGSYLPIRPVAGDADFIAECVKLLNDVPYAQHCSIELYEANKQWWSERRFEGDVRRWLDLA